MEDDDDGKPVRGGDEFLVVPFPESPDQCAIQRRRRNGHTGLCLHLADDSADFLATGKGKDCKASRQENGGKLQ